MFYICWNSGHATPKHGTLAYKIFQAEGIWETAGAGKIFWTSPEAGPKILTWEVPFLYSREKQQP